ncbi:MAG: DNA polymerase III subunit beta [Mycoplasmataceae bacterium]|nr:DNA polymerase III subunit beta [Mycoplasmataceae bacterium]
MKIKVNGKEFTKILEEISKCINMSNMFLPLRGFLIDVLEDRMTITGSDGNLSTIKTILQKENFLLIDEPGRILVPSSLLTNIIKKCDGMLEMNNSDNILFINSGKDKYEINLMEISEYPAIDFALLGIKLTINAKELREAAKNVLFAASSTDVDVIFNGVNIDYSDNKMKLIATDSYRVAYQEIDVVDSRNVNFNVSLFAKNLKEFIPEFINGDVEMFVNEYKINLIFDNTIIQSKLIDAPYKDVSKIFPETFSKLLTIEKKELIDAINKAIVISSDSFHRLRFEIDQKEIKIISVREEIGNSVVTIENKSYSGEDFVLTVNYKYLKEALSVFEGEVKINFNNSIDRFVIVGKSNPKNKQLIAPQRSY